MMGLELFNDEWIGKDVEGSGHGIIQAFAYSGWEKPLRFSGQSRFEPTMSWLEIRSFAAWDSLPSEVAYWLWIKTCLIISVEKEV
jgi:hypothetical protein